MTCRILYVLGQLRAGGLERQLCYLLRAIDRERYPPAVAVWNFCEDDFYIDQLRDLRVPIYSPRAGSSGVSKLKWVRHLASELKPEVIHSYSFYTNFGAWYAAAGTGAINIGSVRSDFANAIEDSGLGLGRFCARWPRAQIFNSVSAAENARKRGGAFVPREISVVRNALDLDRFAPSPLPRNELLKIIAIGSLVPVKRWDRLLKAACRLKQEGFIFVIRIAGDGPLRQSLLEKATELNIAHEVELIGQTENVPGLLSEATLLVHTSESEGCPNAVMEAMACARPVVATDVGDTRFLIEDGKTGFVVQNRDNGALAERIANLMNDRELCVRMGKAGRAKAEKEFGLQRLVAETLGAYRAVGWRGT